MNRHETLALVLAAIAALGAFGGTALGAAPVDGSAPADGDDAPAVQDEGQNETVSLVAAMNAAANETADRNGTVVGAERGQTDGLLDFGDGGDENVYTVDVLMPNGTHVELAVNATNGSVVDSEGQEEGFLEGIFQEDEVPDEPLNLSAMYNATEAVQLAQEETDANGTVASVQLNQRDDQLVYEVRMRADDEQRTVVVAAMRDAGGVVETETGDTALDTATRNATTTDGG